MNESDGVEKLLAEVRLRRELCKPGVARELREAAGVTMSRMADAISVSRTTLHHWETGGHQPTADGLERWGRALAGLRDLLADQEPLSAESLVEDAFEVRVRNPLLRSGLITLADVAECSEADLHTIRNFGLGSVATVKDVLASAGLSLSDTLRVPSFEPDFWQRWRRQEREQPGNGDQEARAESEGGDLTSTSSPVGGSSSAAEKLACFGDGESRPVLDVAETHDDIVPLRSAR